MNSQQKKFRKYLIFALIMFFFLFFLLFVIIQNLIGQQPQGIGGFVYQEIEWTEQTYNLMINNCEGGGIFYFESKHQLGCFREKCRVDGYCKKEIYYFPIIVGVER